MLAKYSQQCKARSDKLLTHVHKKPVNYKHTEDQEERERNAQPTLVPTDTECVGEPPCEDKHEELPPQHSNLKKNVSNAH